MRMTLYDFVISYLDPEQLFTVDLNDGKTRVIKSEDNSEDEWNNRDRCFDSYAVINVCSYIDSDGLDKINIIIDTQ